MAKPYNLSLYVILACVNFRNLEDNVETNGYFGEKHTSFENISNKTLK